MKGDDITRRQCPVTEATFKACPYLPQPQDRHRRRSVGQLKAGAPLITFDQGKKTGGSPRCFDRLFREFFLFMVGRQPGRVAEVGGFRLTPLSLCKGCHTVTPRFRLFFHRHTVVAGFFASPTCQAVAWR